MVTARTQVLGEKANEWQKTKVSWKEGSLGSKQWEKASLARWCSGHLVSEVSSSVTANVSVPLAVQFDGQLMEEKTKFHPVNQAPQGAPGRPATSCWVCLSRSCSFCLETFSCQRQDRSPQMCKGLSCAVFLSVPVSGLDRCKPHGNLLLVAMLLCGEEGTPKLSSRACALWEGRTKSDWFQ